MHKKKRDKSIDVDAMLDKAMGTTTTKIIKKPKLKINLKKYSKLLSGKGAITKLVVKKPTRVIKKYEDDSGVKSILLDLSLSLIHI